MEHRVDVHGVDDEMDDVVLGAEQVIAELGVDQPEGEPAVPAAAPAGELPAGGSAIPAAGGQPRHGAIREPHDSDESDADPELVAAMRRHERAAAHAREQRQAQEAQAAEVTARLLQLEAEQLRAQESRRQLELEAQDHRDQASARQLQREEQERADRETALRLEAELDRRDVQQLYGGTSSGLQPDQSALLPDQSDIRANQSGLLPDQSNIQPDQPELSAPRSAGPQRFIVSDGTRTDGQRQIPIPSVTAAKGSVPRHRMQNVHTRQEFGGTDGISRSPPAEELGRPRPDTVSGGGFGLRAPSLAVPRRPNASEVPFPPAIYMLNNSADYVDSLSRLDVNDAPRNLGANRNTAQALQLTVAKEALTPPKQKLKDGDKLQDSRDLLHVLHHVRLTTKLVIRKTWSGPVEAWVLEQVLPDSRASYKIDEALCSLLPHDDMNYFKDMDDYKLFLRKIFFVGRATHSVIEEHWNKVTLRPNEPETASNRKTTLGYANLIQELVDFAPEGEKYPESIILARIRGRLPVHVRTKLTEIELHTKIFLTTFDQLKPVLEQIDAQFQSEQSKKEKKPPASPAKRKAAEASLSMMHTPAKNRNSNSGGKQSNKLDKRPPCNHCKKPGHNESTCWIKYPDKKPNFKPRNNGNEAPTAAAFQALAAQVAALTAATNK